VPKSFKDCDKIKDFPSTPFEVPPFQQPFKQAPVKKSKGLTCNADSCLDVYEYNEVYDPKYELIPKDLAPECDKGTKMLLYDGIFPGPTVVQQIGRQVRIPPLTHTHISTDACAWHFAQVLGQQ
jgi:hypothetical protein